MFTSGFTMHPEHLPKNEQELTIQWMQNIAKKLNTAVVGSLAIQENNSYFNRLYFVKPDRTFSFYNKRHTFSLAGEDKVYEAGKEKLTVNYKGFVFCPLICYDLRFPVWARNVENYDVLLYVANWPKTRIAAWDTLLKARAIENMAYCIGVNRTGVDASGYEYPGHSAVYDVLGNQLVFSETDEVLLTTLSKKLIKEQREKLKFLEDRDTFILQ